MNCLKWLLAPVVLLSLCVLAGCGEGVDVDPLGYACLGIACGVCVVGPVLLAGWAIRDSSRHGMSKG